MFSKSFTESRNRSGRLAPRRFIESVEALEGRALPSTFTVLNFAIGGQGGNGGDGFGGGAFNDGTSALTLTNGWSPTITLTAARAAAKAKASGAACTTSDCSISTT